MQRFHTLDSWLRRLLAVVLAICSAMTLATPFAASGWAQTQQTWSALGPSGTEAQIYQFAADPKNDSIVYLAAPGGGIWKSTDGALTWKPIYETGASVSACSVAIDPGGSGAVYVGTGNPISPRPSQGVARSLDGGQTWSIGSRFTNRPVCAVAVDPTNLSRVLAGSQEGLFRSIDGGARWSRVRSYPVLSIVFDPAGTAYVGEIGPTESGLRDDIVARSTDGGFTWANIPLSLPDDESAPKTLSVSVLPRGSTIFVAVCFQQAQQPQPQVDFYKSADGGGSWSLNENVATAVPPIQIFSSSLDAALYLTGTSLYRSADNGSVWSPVRSLSGNYHTGVFTKGQILTAGEGLLSLFPIGLPSSNSFGLPMGEFLGVAWDSTGRAWAAGPSGLYVDQPQRPLDIAWDSVLSTPVGGVVAPATNSQNIFVAGSGTVLYTNNLGTTFTDSVPIPAGEPRAPAPPIAVSPTNANQAFVAGQNLYRTTNGGAAWTKVAAVDPNGSRVVVALAMAPTNVRFMYAATACLSQTVNSSCPNQTAIWRSTNTGATWTLAATIQGLVTRMIVDSRQTATVYATLGAFPGGANLQAGYNPGDLLLSIDSGTTWTSIGSNLPDGPINAIALDPNSVPSATFTPPTVQPGPGGTVIIRPPTQQTVPRAQTLYVGTDNGVFVTFNQGLQWASISSGLPAVPVTQLVFQSGKLLASTFGRGVFQSSLASLSTGLIATPLSLTLSAGQGTVASSGISLFNSSTTPIAWQLTALDPWLSASVTSGSLKSGESSGPVIRANTSGLGIGTYYGRIRVTGGGLTQDVYVTLNITVPPAAMSIVAGNSVSAPTGSAVRLSVSVADSSAAPVPGVAVNFAVSGGGALASPASISDVAGIAKNTLTLPSTPGIVQVVASFGNLSVTFNLTAILSITPALSGNSVVNGVTFNPTSPPSPGSIVSIFGTNLATDRAGAVSLPLPKALLSTRVVLTAGGADLELPLFYVSPQQVNAVLPFDVAPGTYGIRVEATGVSGNSIPVTIAAYSPGVFTVNGSGSGQGIFLKNNGSMVSSANPATPGTVLTLFATGLGTVNPPVDAGSPGSAAEPLNRTVQTPKVFFDNIQAQVLYSGLAPGFAGLYQINVVVPPGVSAATNVPVSVSIGGIGSNDVAVAVGTAGANTATVVTIGPTVTPGPTGASSAGGAAAAANGAAAAAGVTGATGATGAAAATGAAGATGATGTTGPGGARPGPGGPPPGGGGQGGVGGFPPPVRPGG